MTTPTGQISLNDVNVELGLSGTTTISLNQTNVRTLAGVASGQISMNDLRGKSNRVSLSYTYSANTANASLDVTSISGYIAGKSDITITVNSGVYLYSTSTANAGLTLTGGSTGDTITLVNNGYIMGQGGAGGNGPTTPAAEAGGPALSLGFNTTINNTNSSAYIGGGGGGGGGYTGATGGARAGGGGAGGGRGGHHNGTSGGGAGGSVGSNGANGTAVGNDTGGGGGGRVFPSTTTVGPTSSTGGSVRVGLGGSGGGTGSALRYTINGVPVKAGDGGGTNQNGGDWSGGSSNSYAGGGGGGYGASGGASGHGTTTRRTGAAGGKAVSLNGYSVTWVSSDTTRVYGAVS